MPPRLVPTAPERTADKPGPGPVPAQVLRALDLAVMKRIESLVPGEHLTPQTGSGTELAMIRPYHPCLLYTSPSPRDGLLSRMPSSA